MVLHNYTRPPKKVAPAAEGGTCPRRGHHRIVEPILPMSARNPFYTFHKLELIK